MSDSFSHVELPGVRQVEGFHVLGATVPYGQIGKGASGKVLVAVDLLSGEDVAVKCLTHADARLEERFHKEARSGAAIDHPAIVKVRRIGRDRKSGVRYFVMDLVLGESMQERVARGGPLRIEDATAVVAGIARGLSALHQQGFVHRDVKPANVLLSTTGEVRIADLGLLKDTGSVSEITMTGELLGTPSYVAPEQWRNPRSVGPQADVYALGATYRYLLTGAAPRRRDADASAEDSDGALARLPASVASWIQTATAADPADRFATASEALPALEAIQTECGPGDLRRVATERPVESYRHLRPSTAVLDRITDEVRPRPDDVDADGDTVRRLVYVLLALLAVAAGIACGIWIRGDGTP